MIRFEIDQVEIDYNFYQNRYYIKLPTHPSKIKVYFKPWKIKPLIRIDNHLCNYGLAKFNQFDHMVEFFWTPNFFHNYFASIVETKTKWFEKLNQKNIQDKVGVEVEHTDLVEKIKANLK